MTKCLTDRFVAGIRCQTRDNFFDTKARGLVLRVGPRTKAWFFVYGGAPRWLRLGEYPSMPLADARAEAAAQRKLLERDGLDPVDQRRADLTPPAEPERPAVFTFGDFVPTFIAFQKGRKKTWRDDEMMLTRHLLPLWRDRPLREITRTHVHEMLDAIVGKGLTVGVNRVQALISRMFTLALDRQLIDAHPAARVIKRYRETARERVLSDDELRALWMGLDAHQSAASEAMQLRLLLGQRGGEVADLTWRELDLEAALWSLPGTRAKNRRPHVVPLPPTALAVLTRRRKVIADDEPRVFPGYTLQGDEQRALAPLHGGAFEWKDLRRTVATRLGGLGHKPIVGRVLNHARASVTDRHYDQFEYLDEKRRALADWDEELQRILKNEPKKATRVLAMRRPS